MAGGRLSIRSLYARWRESTPEIRDLVHIIVATAAGAALVFALDVNDSLVLWVHSNGLEFLGLDDLPMAFTLIAIGIAWFAHRRWRQYKDEVKAHQATIAQLHQAMRQVTAANQAKAQFLAAMSHELRTPLNAILGFSEIIERQSFGPGATARYVEYAKDIHSSGSHLLSIVSDIPEMARSEAGALRFEPQSVDVRPLFAQVSRMIAEKAKAGSLEITMEVAAPVAVWADRDKLVQSVLNVAFNAIKFTPPGGRITFRARPEEDMVVLEIADTGVGIAEADITRAFTPFEQVDNSLQRRFEGTGLGLPLAKQYVEQQGGALSLASAVGCGTTVTIRLSRARPVETQAIA